MSDDESQHDLPTEGGEIFAETVQKPWRTTKQGLPSWPAAEITQTQTAFAEQLATGRSVGQAKAQGPSGGNTKSRWPREVTGIYVALVFVDMNVGSILWGFPRG